MNLLKKYRLSRGYSHQRMAIKLKISKSYYWQLENNLRRLSYEMAVKIADVFDTTPDELFYEQYKIKNNDLKLKK